MRGNTNATRTEHDTSNTTAGDLVQQQGQGRRNSDKSRATRELSDDDAAVVAAVDTAAGAGAARESEC